MTTVGLFMEHQDAADLFWEQCDEPYGHHRGIELRGCDRTADHILVIGTPVRPGARPSLSATDRVAAAWKKDSGRRKLDAAWRALDLPRDRTSVLFYEPTPHVKDMYYELARAYAARVHGTDPRADEQVTLGSTWLIAGTVQELRALSPPEKPVSIAAVSSGKNFMPGHGPRLSFFARLQEAGVPLQMFGRGLPAATRPRGSVNWKRSVLEPARFTLALENYIGSPHYVTEKLWDALLCWCLPFYYGAPDADVRIPEEAFLRLPDLEEAGVETVREALARPSIWDERLEAIAEARRLILDELRMVEWIRRMVGGGA